MNIRPLEDKVLADPVEEGAHVRKDKSSFAYNAASARHSDLAKDGVLDPDEVTRFALQNAEKTDRPLEPGPI